MEWTFGRKLGLGFAIALLVLLVTSTLGYRSTHNLIENDRMVSHTYQVRRDISDLDSSLKDAETAVRGFALSGDPAFLAPHDDAAPRIERMLSEIARLTADNPGQQRRVEALRAPINERLAQLREIIQVRRSSGLEAASRFVALGGGLRAMDRVLSLLREMDRAELDLLERRNRTAEASANTAKTVILWASLLGAAVVLMVAGFISRTLSAQLGGAAQQVQSSSAELQAAATQQAAGAREQATAMSEITTTISELLATSRQIAESAQRVAQIAEQTAAAARAGDKTVERGNESVTGMRRQMEAIVHRMLELGRKSQQIGAVLDIVAELAEQTNILAINATIEAAGAGEAGRRFAVVADEIRKLADRVAGSTKDIRALIDEVRGAVNTTVMTTETGSKTVEAGADQFFEVASAFKQIVGQVATTREAAKEIELSTKQQASAVEQVNLAATNVAQATRESEASTTQTAQTAAQLAELSRELLRIVQPRASA
ncbi:MAG: methyl-accepting chemotaxis protein [Polyangiales bacterium]